MNVIFSLNIQARNEIEKLSMVGSRMVSYQTKGPIMGSHFDSLIGSAELSKDGVLCDKWHAMALFAQINNFEKPVNFQAKQYSGRELITMILPKINIVKKPSIYMPQFAPFIKYNPKDTMVEIKNGVLLKGILDKSTIGQGSDGSIYHIINNEYGSAKALETIYSLAQITTDFFYYHGFTLGIGDLIISDKAINQVRLNTETLIHEANKITEKLDRGDLTAPIGISLQEFYESEQLNSLSSGDTFVIPILSDIDFNKNHLTRIVFTGSRGKASNVISINAACGSVTINDKRPLRNAGFGRTSPYFPRYDMSPIANGYISTSFKEGLLAESFPFQAAEARHALISNALSTSVTGYANRICIKNLESMITDNMRKSVKNQNMIQPLYAEFGVDLRRFEKVKIPTASCSTADINKWLSSVKDFPHIKPSPRLETALLDEFAQIKQDREEFRRIWLKLEEWNQGIFLFDDVVSLPVNVPKIILDTMENYQDVIKQIPEKKHVFDPVEVINKVKILCQTLKYVYYNKHCEKRNIKVPEYIECATTFVKIAIRCYMSSANLRKLKVPNFLIDVIIGKIKQKYKNALIDYGTTVGILAAQCVSEPQTQYVLDSRHRSGGGGSTKTNAILRSKEIMSVVPTDKMKNPSMTIMIKEKYQMDKAKVQEIANHIEMMDLGRFVYSSMVFFEEYKNITHPKFQNENAIIREFEKYNYGIQVPTDLSKWCIRFELDRENLLLYSMKLDTIITQIRNKYPNLFIIWTPENAPKLIIRCYLRNIMIKPNLLGEKLELSIIDIMRGMRKIIIRGTRDIKSTYLTTMVQSKITETGEIKADKVFAVGTIGTNLEEILENPYIDPFRTQTDSITEFESMFGIEAARSKIIVEMIKNMNTLNRDHCTVFADEMTFLGKVTSIQKTGLQNREMSNITLRLSFQSQIQVIQEAASDALIDHISGVSGPLILGTVPQVGTLYNRIIVNDEFVSQKAQKIQNIEDEL